MDNPSSGQGNGWDRVRFGSRSHRPGADSSEDRAQTRFVTGVAIFIAVALAYPWYSYWVNARITAYALEAVSDDLHRQSRRSQALAQQRNVIARQQQADEDYRRRTGAVRVVGTTNTRTGPVAIVQLGASNIEEAKDVICRQSEAMLQEPLDGRMLRIQRHRGNAPSLDAGEVRC